MKIAIPTHGRALLIDQLTLGYLRRCGVQDKVVRLFVQDEAQAGLYRSRFPDCQIVVTNTSTVKEKFNFIHTYFPPGEEVLVLEDDLQSVKKLAGYNKLEEETNLAAICIEGFKTCRMNETALWGISSNSNPFFMKEQVSVGFKFIVANMYGFIATYDNILITQESKTDYERTILYYRKYGKVVRLDYLCPITKNYTTPGGMQDLRSMRADMEQRSVDYLTKTYPDLCQANTTKSSQYAELKLRTKKS